MKRIELTQGQVALVDDRDYEWLSQWRWYFDPHHSGIDGYAVRKCHGRKIRMHLEIAKRMRCEGRVDHRNRNKLDNRRHNLRLASASQDGANRVRRQKKTSRFRGVSWYKQTGRWHAQITVKQKVQHLGYFEGTPKGEEEAALAYNKAATREFSEFAQLNEV